jgi:hypothetical protein
MCGVRKDSDSTINYIAGFVYSQEKKCKWMEAAVAVMIRCIYMLKSAE